MAQSRTLVSDCSYSEFSNTKSRRLIKCRCSTSSNLNFLCNRIDEQIADRICNIQIDSRYSQTIRVEYVKQLGSIVSKTGSDERRTLESALRELAEEELCCARLHAKQQISNETWETLWKEWQDQRNAIRANLEAMDRSCHVQVATLDDALRLIAKAGILFNNLPQQGQQELLRHIVNPVVINPERQLLRMEVGTPFSYLQQW